MNARREKRRKWHGPEKQMCSKAAYGQENWKAQQKQGVAKGTLGECSKC